MSLKLLSDFAKSHSTLPKKLTGLPTVLLLKFNIGLVIGGKTTYHKNLKRRISMSVLETSL